MMCAGPALSQPQAIYKPKPSCTLLLCCAQALRHGRRSPPRTLAVSTAGKRSSLLLLLPVACPPLLLLSLACARRLLLALTDTPGYDLCMESSLSPLMIREPVRGGKVDERGEEKDDQGKDLLLLLLLLRF